MVATMAFSMGINTRGVRGVVHYGAPLSMSSYMQGQGRGGRDGCGCRCFLFFDKRDFRHVHWQLAESKPGDARARIMRDSKEMCELLVSVQCREQICWIHYSGGGQALDKCGACDNCRGGTFAVAKIWRMTWQHSLGHGLRLLANVVSLGWQ